TNIWLATVVALAGAALNLLLLPVTFHVGRILLDHRRRKRADRHGNAGSRQAAAIQDKWPMRSWGHHQRSANTLASPVVPCLLKKKCV
ncbi:hypothetical protein L0337_45865, partial [candidate division KSB1 bacterium]|nr:hypothetical protein [candidate division KSB1 bacterium]